MMKLNKTILVLLFIFSILLINSCSAPWSKEEYLDDYASFIDEVASEYKSYTSKDWKKQDAKYAKFNGEWYKKFKKEYTWKEEVILAKYTVQYNIYNVKGDIDDLFTSVFGTRDEIEKKIKYYVENNMEEDLEFLIKQAQEISEATEKLILELIEKYQELNR